MEFKNPATDAEKAYDEITSRIKVDLEKVTEELMGSSIYHFRSNEMKVDVYHLNRDTANKNAMISKLVDQFGKTLDDLATVASFVKGWLPANDGYNYVATVECYNIGDVFKLTNHIRSPWMNNEEIIQVTAPARRHRSTSVGDLYIVRDEAGEHRNRRILVLRAGLLDIDTVEVI